MDQEPGEHYGHALCYAWLTSVYDPVTRCACREKKFKAELVEQVCLEPGELALDRPAAGLHG